MAKITDMTRPVDLLQHASGTGHRRTQQPVYMDFMPPCNSACPAGENIQAWLNHAQAGRYYEAFLQIMEDNPFPAVMGRICVKPCETGCNRNHIDTTVNIHAVERFIGDSALQHNWQVAKPEKQSGKRVMVVGAGPGGLPAAWHLARMGHQVEMFEAQAEPGGLLYIGVPEYRLPKDIVQAEIKRILDAGIRLHVNYKVTDLQDEMQNRGFDAAYLSIGAHAGIGLHYDGTAQIPIMEALEFLKLFKTNNLPAMGQTVVVYGGSKMAMYIARVLRRLGVTPMVLYPGDRKLMPAYDFEADDALGEGVEIAFLRSIKRIDGKKLTLEVMQVVKGKPEPTGDELLLEADALITAMGQHVDSTLYRDIAGIETKSDGGIVINSTSRMTGCAGIFAGGDMLPGELRSATIAIGNGKKAARNLNAWLQGATYEKPPKPPTAGYKRLHMWYQTDAPLAAQPAIAASVASRSFEEVVKGLPEADARYEAQRCLSCGNCFECDGCFGACPEDAIIKLGKGNRYKFNYDACTGCGICYEQCPCHAIEMIAEPVKAEVS